MTTHFLRLSRSTASVGNKALPCPLTKCCMTPAGDKKAAPITGTAFISYKNSVGLLSLCFFSRSFSCRSLCSRSSFSSSSLLGRTARTSCFLSHLILSHVLVVVNEFDEAHLGIVTQTVASLDDASVATRTVGNLHRDFLEEFSYSILVLQVAKYYTTRVCSVVL